MDSMLKKPRNILLFFMPDYILKSMMAQGVHLSDLGDLFTYNNNKPYTTDKDRFNNVSVDNLKTKISNSLSKQDYTDLWFSNLLGLGLVYNKFSLDFLTKMKETSLENRVIPITLLYYLRSDFRLWDLNNVMLKEFVSSMVDSNRPILEKSMEESDLVQFEVVGDILFVVFKKGFFNFSLNSTYDFRHLFISTLIISLFRFFPEEDVYKSNIFSLIFQIFYKQ